MGGCDRREGMSAGRNRRWLVHAIDQHLVDPVADITRSDGKGHVGAFLDRNDSGWADRSIGSSRGRDVVVNDNDERRINGVGARNRRECVGAGRNCGRIVHAIDQHLGDPVAGIDRCNGKGLAGAILDRNDSCRADRSVGPGGGGDVVVNDWDERRINGMGCRHRRECIGAGRNRRRIIHAIDQHLSKSVAAARCDGERLIATVRHRNHSGRTDGATRSGGCRDIVKDGHHNANSGADFGFKRDALGRRQHRLPQECGIDIALVSGPTVGGVAAHSDRTPETETAAIPIRIK